MAVVAGCVDLLRLRTKEVINMSTYEKIIVILTIVEVIIQIIEIIIK